MRILHTSDWHLGRTFHGQVLDEAHAALADHLVDLVTAESVDAVLVSGDVYDRAVPPASAVTLLDQTLRRLAERTRVVLTPGNHDSAHRLGFAAELMRRRLVIRARTTDVGRGIVLPDAQGRDAVIVHALPYLDPDTTRESLPHLLAQRLGEELPASPPASAGPESAEEDADGEGSSDSPDPQGPSDSQGSRPRLARSHEAVVSAALRLVASDLERLRSGRTERLPSVVMAHAFVLGGRASESERDIRVGGVDAVPSHVFTDLGGSPLAQACGGLDYAALGHLHRPQEVHRPGARTAGSTSESTAGSTGEEGGRGPRLVYPGSPLALSFEEAEVPRAPAGSRPAGESSTEHPGKSSVLLEVGSTGVRSLERIPVPVRHQVRTVEGTMAHLLSPATDDAAEPGCWVRVILHGERPPGALATLRQRFPGLLAFRHEAPERLARGQVTVTARTDPMEVVTRFLDDVGGRPPEEAERAVLRQAYEASLAAGGSRA